MVEVKVTSATVASFIASLGVAILNGVVADNSVLGGMTAWLQWVILTTAPTVITFLGGYVTSSSTSAVSDGFIRESETRNG